MSVSWEALTDDIERTAPRRGERTSWAFYEFIREAKRRARQGDTMGRQARADADGWAAIHLGSTLHGGSGTVRGNAGVGRKGAGKRLTPAEAKKLMRQQVAKERKLAAEAAKRNAAAKRAARAQRRARQK